MTDEDVELQSLSDRFPLVLKEIDHSDDEARHELRLDPVSNGPKKNKVSFRSREPSFAPSVYFQSESDFGRNDDIANEEPVAMLHSNGNVSSQMDRQNGCLFYIFVTLLAVLVFMLCYYLVLYIHDSYVARFA